MTNWDTIFPSDPTESQLVADILKKGVLMSRGIACENGVIYAGDVDVGGYEVIEQGR